MRLYEAGRRAGTFPFPAGAQGGLCLGPSTGRRDSWVLLGTLEHPPLVHLWVWRRSSYCESQARQPCHLHNVVRATQGQWEIPDSLLGHYERQWGCQG